MVALIVLIAPFVLDVRIARIVMIAPIVVVSLMKPA